MALRDLSTPEGFGRARMDEMQKYYEALYQPRVQALLQEIETLTTSLEDADAELHRVAQAAKTWAHTLGHKFTDTAQILLSRSRFFKRRNGTYNGVGG